MNDSTLTSWAEDDWPAYTPDEILPGLFQGGTKDNEVLGYPATSHHNERKFSVPNSVEELLLQSHDAKKKWRDRVTQSARSALVDAAGELKTQSMEFSSKLMTDSMSSGSRGRMNKKPNKPSPSDPKEQS